MWYVKHTLHSFGNVGYFRQKGGGVQNSVLMAPHRQSKWRSCFSCYSLLLLLLQGTGMSDEWMLTGETREALGCLLVLNRDSWVCMVSQIGGLVTIMLLLRLRDKEYPAWMPTSAECLCLRSTLCGWRKQAMKVTAYPITAMYLMNWLWYDYSFIISGFKYLI